MVEKSKTGGKKIDFDEFYDIMREENPKDYLNKKNKNNAKERYDKKIIILRMKIIIEKVKNNKVILKEVKIKNLKVELIKKKIITIITFKYKIKNILIKLKKLIMKLKLLSIMK